MIELKIENKGTELNISRVQDHVRLELFNEYSGKRIMMEFTSFEFDMIAEYVGDLIYDEDFVEIMKMRSD